MRLQHGFIGKKEIELAKEELQKCSSRKDENIYVQNMAGYGGNIVRGQWFNEIEELTDCQLYKYSTIEEYNNEMLDSDDEYVYEKDRLYHDEILDLLEYGKTAYMVSDNGGNVYIGEDETVILDSIRDGDIHIYSYDEAVENLSSEYVDESLVIWLLS